MKEFSLYRKRIIPDECILLKNDHIVSFENNRLVTTWSALHPKKDLHHGISCYFLEHGINDRKDDDVKKMLTFANAAASLITTRKGALRVMPEKGEVEAVIK